MTDGNGAPVPDLAPADFTVKEGGKERDIVKAAPATARMRLTVMAEERLLGDGGVRMGLFEFMKRLQPVSETSFITIGLRNKTIVDYTTDINAIVAGLNGLSLNPPPQTNLTEGILDIGKAIERDRPERPVVVVVAVSGGQSGGASSNEVLNQLRQSGAGDVRRDHLHQPGTDRAARVAGRREQSRTGDRRWCEAVGRPARGSHRDDRRAQGAAADRQ